MKFSFFTLLFILFFLPVFSQKYIIGKVTLPLDNKIGVPFSKSHEIDDIYIDGFEVDGKDNFYFLGGENADRFVATNGDKITFRKTFREFAPGAKKLYFDKGELYTLSRYTPVELFAINPVSGGLRTIPIDLKNNKLNGFKFIDAGLILQVFIGSKYAYQQYDLNGNFVGAVPNEDNRPVFNFPPYAEYLGLLNGNFLFWLPNDKVLHADVLVQTDNTGRILVKKALPGESVLGEPFAENPPEHRKYRKGCLYILAQKGKSVLVTKIDVNSFFGN